MSVQEQIVKVFREFGKDTARALKASADAALAAGGRKGVQTIKLDFNELLKTTPDGDVILDIQAVNGKKGVKYWGAIEKGRRGKEQNTSAGDKMPTKMIPADVVGKEWQNQYNIDPRVVILNIQARARAKKRGLNYADRKFKKVKKTLNYDKAAKTLSFIIQRSIHKKGIKPKPFVNRVLDDGRIQKLRNDLTPLLGQQFKLIITGLEA